MDEVDGFFFVEILRGLGKTVEWFIGSEDGWSRLPSMGLKVSGGRWSGKSFSATTSSEENKVEEVNKVLQVAAHPREKKGGSQPHCEAWFSRQHH